MTQLWALRGLRWSYCAFIACSSGMTFLQAHAGHNPHIMLLAGVELIAIAAFLLPGLERGACAVLLGVYFIAALITAVADHEMPIRFAYFAMTALSIVTLDRSSARLL